MLRLCVVLPAFNEEPIIAASCRAVLACLGQQLPAWQAELIVADNGSTDRTAEIVQQLAAREVRLRYLRVPVVGKGSAIRAGWQVADADVYVFMDADLATDLAALPALVQAVASGQADVAIGSRYAPGAQVERDWLRRFVSRGYQVIFRWLLRVPVRDAPCGFKAVSRRVRDHLLPAVQSDAWFFDSELVVLAHRAGYRIAEVPVRWREPVVAGRSSKVKIWSLSLRYLAEVLRLRRRLKRGEQGAGSREQGLDDR